MFYLILFSILFFSSCDLPEEPICNSQDNESSCYISAPAIVNISSYDTRSIEIEFDDYALIDFSPDYAIIVRESPNDTVTIITDTERPISTTSPFYRDSKNININTSYHYSIKFFDNEDNPSIFVKDSILHEMAIPTDFLLEQQGAAIIEISWSHIPNIKDSINSILGFEIFKTMIVGQDITESTITLNSSKRSYTDYDIIPYTTYQYKIRTIYTNNDFSDFTVPVEKILEFPQVETTHWYFKDLESISISIEFDEQDGWDDVQMSLSRRRDEPGNQTDGYEVVFSGYPIQDLDKYSDKLESPMFNERWEYLLDWWSGSYHDTLYIPIITLPTSNLVYIEGSDLAFDLLNDIGNVDSIAPFYVYSIEIPYIDYALLGGPDANPNFLNEESFLPKGSISIEAIIEQLEAFTRDWYIPPSGINYTYSSLLPYGGEAIPDSPDLTKEGFRLLMESEWEYLARDKGNDGDYKDYSFGSFSESSLNFYNSANTEHSTTNVGSFNPSPSGIFDLNGNVWEWCHSIEGNGKYVLRGGSYQDEGYECSNASRREISDSSLEELSDLSIGYRMAISATPFINYLKERSCAEKEEGYNGCYE